MNWPSYFDQNRDQRPSIPWEKGIHLPPSLREALIPSLQRFQVGESGDGHYLKRNAATTGDASYFMAVDLFIKEEQEHSRMLGRVLSALHAPLMKQHWSATVFRWMRRAMGLKQELLMLLVAEMIAKKYYAALRDGVDDPVLKAACAQILDDELGHLRFHIEHLNRFFETWPFAAKMLVCEAWRVCYRIVCLVVWLDHRQALRAVNVSMEEFWWDCGMIFEEVSGGIFNRSARTDHQPATMAGVAE